jgi:predicted ArsR family transcriptional regulator
MGNARGVMTFRETTIKYIKDVIRAKTIHEIIATELHDAHLRKLEAETAAEYAHANIQYNEERIKRLEAQLLKHTKEGDYA